jgi:hypothetical protein
MTDPGQEKWFVKYWRPAAAWIYLSICVFDFVIMPVYHLRAQGSLDHVWEMSMRLRPEDQLQAVVQLTRKTTWDPITLSESGIFHLAFGALLGVAAWTRGRVQEARVKTGSGTGGEDDPDSYASQQPSPRPPQRSRQTLTE